MHGFPDRSKFQFLCGQELVSVLVAQHCSVFNFLQGAVITVEGNAKIGTSGLVLTPKEVGIIAIDLIGLSIADFDIVRSREASILWSNECSMLLIDDSDLYESFWFSDESKGISIAV